MPPTKKTDNANLAGKLHLRRYFLERYPPPVIPIPPLSPIPPKPIQPPPKINNS